MGEESEQQVKRTHCRSGHKLSGKNVKILNKGGGRKYLRCLTCFPLGKITAAQSANLYERPEGSRMRQAISKGVFGDAMTRAEIMNSRSK